MTSNFFDQFPYLHWQEHSLQETKPNIAEAEFTLQAKDQAGTKLSRLGIERLVVIDGVIRHMEVRNR